MKNIAKKLLDFQKLGIRVTKSAENPYFKNKYANLNEVLDKVKPELNKLGILISQSPQKDGLKTQLIDVESGEVIEGFLEYAETGTAQRLGSSNTYNRRYSLVTMLNLEDEDDDGNEASLTISLGDAIKKIDNAKTVKELTNIYNAFKQYQEKDEFKKALSKKKEELKK